MADNEREFKIKISTDASATVEGAAQAAEGLKQLGTAGVKAAEETVAADDKAFASKTQLKQAVKGLQTEFPVLGSIARMALNPITLVVAGITAAFTIWKTRVDEVTRSIAGVELPEISPVKIGQVTAMAEAWKAYKDALDGALKSYNSIEGASERALKSMQAETEQQSKLLEGRKQLELASLDKAGMSPAGYELARLGIEDRYGAAGRTLKGRSTEDEIYLRQEEARALRESASRKLGEAGSIKVGTAEQDAQTEADLKARAEKAQKDIGMGRARIARLTEFNAKEGGIWENIKTSIGGPFRYGLTASSDSAIEQERGAIAAEQGNVSAYDAWLRKKPSRDAARKRKFGLATEAGAEEGRAGMLEAGDLGSQEAAIRESRTDAEVGRMDTSARYRIAIGKAKDQEQAALSEMLNAAEAGTRVSAQLMARVKALTALVAELTKRERDLEGRPPRM